MKKLISLISVIMMIGLAYPAQAQENLWYSSSNFNEPQIIFSNPAGIAFKDFRQVIFSSQLLYTGLANDNLYNHYLGYIEPAKNIGAFGLRGSYFNSLLLDQGTISLLYSRFLVKSKLSFGINLNLHQYSYNRDKFNLNEIDDPLLANSTSKVAFGSGIGILYNPITDLLLGMSIDNFNQPDISLQGGQAKKPMIANLGISYHIFGLVPELDLRYFNYSERNETYLVFGLRQLLLDNAANLFVQYRQNCFSIGGAYTFKKFRLDYQYTYPLNELQEISNGSHQFTLSYNFGKYEEYSTAPKIILISPKVAEVDTNEGIITSSPPKIEILTPLEQETRTSSLRLKVSLEFVVDIKDFKIKVNGEEIKLRGIKPLTKEQDKMELEAEFDLEEGMNDIEVIAHNFRGSNSQKKAIRYNPITEDFYNQRWAVVIGIDKYQDDNFDDLSYAVKDAKGIEKLLRDYFQFNKIITLYDGEATRDNIIRAISSDLKATKEDDGIFIFFAGHGSTGEGITGGPLGYIVPVDGTFNESEFYVKNIPMSLVKEISQTIKAKHIYYVMDCCYGGLLLRGGMDRTEPVLKADYNFLKSLAKNNVRQVLTAGGKGQPVLDGGLAGHSVFTGRLIQGLEGEADINADGFITAEELNFFVRQRVYTDVDDIVRGHPIYKDVEQTPQYGKWFGEGEFIFRSSSK